MNNEIDKYWTEFVGEVCGISGCNGIDNIKTYILNDTLTDNNKDISEADVGIIDIFHNKLFNNNLEKSIQAMFGTSQTGGVQEVTSSQPVQQQNSILPNKYHIRFIDFGLLYYKERTDYRYYPYMFHPFEAQIINRLSVIKNLPKYNKFQNNINTIQEIINNTSKSNQTNTNNLEDAQNELLSKQKELINYVCDTYTNFMNISLNEYKKIINNNSISKYMGGILNGLQKDVENNDYKTIFDNILEKENIKPDNENLILPGKIDEYSLELAKAVDVYSLALAISQKYYTLTGQRIDENWNVVKDITITDKNDPIYDSLFNNFSNPFFELIHKMMNLNPFERIKISAAKEEYIKIIEKIKEQHGGAEIGSGALGTVYHPSLACLDGSYDNNAEYVSKITTIKNANEELELGERIKNIDPNRYYFIYAEKKCNATVESYNKYKDYIQKQQYENFVIEFKKDEYKVYLHNFKRNSYNEYVKHLQTNNPDIEIPTYDEYITNLKMPTYDEYIKNNPDIKVEPYEEYIISRGVKVDESTHTILQMPYGGETLETVKINDNDINEFLISWLQLFEGLELLHQNDMAHMDIKHINIVCKEIGNIPTRIIPTPISNNETSNLGLFDLFKTPEVPEAPEVSEVPEAPEVSEVSEKKKGILEFGSSKGGYKRTIRRIKKAPKRKTRHIRRV